MYDSLSGYAATHRSWSGVQTAVDRVAAATGQRVVLTTALGAGLADSNHDKRPTAPAGAASARVDPLHVDVRLLPAAASTGIDPRAVGPLRLPASERAVLRSRAAAVTACLTGSEYQATVTTTATGRPLVDIGAALSALDARSAACVSAASDALQRPTATERRPLSQLQRSLTRCIADTGGRVLVLPDLSLSLKDADARTAGACLQGARRALLQSWVAPPALVYVTPPDTTTPVRLNLTDAPVREITVAAVIVILVAVLVTVLGGLHLVRPLRRLTEAVGDQRSRRLQVPVNGSDEIARLATALNDLSERRESLERARETMVADISHELRSPVTNIRAWLEAIQDDLAEPSAEVIDSLLDEVLLLQRLVEDVQDLAAAEAGTLRLCPLTIAVDDIVGQVVDGHRGAAEAAGVRLRAQPCALSAHVDGVRLRQVLGNLVSNAIRHTPPGGCVDVSCTRRDETSLAITVTDTGIGIDPVDLPYVFDRFWRADPSRSRTTGGTGLGLAIVRQLVEASGGSVGVTSTPGAGSRFEVVVPASAASPRKAICWLGLRISLGPVTAP